MAGFAVSGSQSKSQQGSTNLSSSFGNSSSSGGQFYDRLSNQIRQGLFNQFNAPANTQGISLTYGGPAGGDGTAMPTRQAITPDQIRAQNAARREAQVNQGYNGPQITQGPIYTPQMTEEELNRQQAQNTAQTQGMLARLPSQLAGRGFASGNSPLMMEMQRRALQQNQATNANLATQFRFDTAKDNAQHRLATESAAQGFFRQMQEEAIKKQEAANQATGNANSLKIAELNSNTSRYNALLSALAGLAGPLSRQRSSSQQGSQSFGSSFGKSSSTSTNVQPFDFGDYSVA